VISVVLFVSETNNTNKKKFEKFPTTGGNEKKKTLCAKNEKGKLKQQQ